MSEVTPIYAWIVQTTEEANQILLAGGKIIIISETVPDYLSSPQYVSIIESLSICSVPNTNPNGMEFTIAARIVAK